MLKSPCKNSHDNFQETSHETNWSWSNFFVPDKILLHPIKPKKKKNLFLPCLAIYIKTKERVINKSFIKICQPQMNVECLWDHIFVSPKRVINKQTNILTKYKNNLSLSSLVLDLHAVVKVCIYVGIYHLVRCIKTYTYVFIDRTRRYMGINVDCFHRSICNKLFFNWFSDIFQSKILFMYETRSL